MDSAVEATSPSIQSPYRDRNERICDPVSARPIDSLQAEIDIADLSCVSGLLKHRVLRALAIASSDLISSVLSALFGWLCYASVRGGTLNEGVTIAMNSVHLISIGSLFVVPAVVIILLSAIHGHYTQFKPIWTENLELLKVAAYTIAVGMFLLFVLAEHFSRVWFLFFWLSLIVMLPMMRLLTKNTLMRHGVWYRPALIIGSSENAKASKATVESDDYIGLKIVGYMSSDNPSDDQEARGHRNLLQVRQYRAKILDDLESRFGKLHIICASDASTGLFSFGEVIDDWLMRTNTITVSTPAVGLPMYGAQSISMFSHDTVLLSLQSNLGKHWARFLKRSFDIIVSVVIVLLLSPLLIPLSIAITLDKGPLIYRSKRIGKDGKLFYCLKFRSMVHNAEHVLANQLAADEGTRLEWNTYFKLTDDPRITRVGRMMRKSSLDELPQLLNVIKGDMSLVGPRPILPEEEQTYGKDLTLYRLIRPGITGLWQVCGRSSLGQAERAQLNTWYTRNWSPWIDIVILLKTIPVTLRGDGAA